MSWISDVKHELSKLVVDIKTLKKFGLTIGAIFILLSFWFIYKNIFYTLSIFIIVIGITLFFGGIFLPSKLKTIYKIWMGSAFAFGWVVSRFLLTILFLFVLTPVGILAKIFKKEFLMLNFKKTDKSFWIRKENTKINYEKMF